MSVSNGNISADIGVRISDSSISKYRIVTGDTTDTTVALCVMKANTGETTQSLGVTQTATTAADENATVRVYGISLVEMGSDTVDINSSVTAEAGGKGAVSTTPDAAQQWAIGFALAPSAADGNIIPVLISPHLIVKGTA
jgi:hypothetical protein